MMNPSTRGQSRKKWRTQESEDDNVLYSDDDSEQNMQGNKMKYLDVVILDEGERIPSAKLKLRKFNNPIQLLDIQNEEEDRDRIAVQMWMNRYNKLFKSLFNKYANTLRNIVDDNFQNKDLKSKYLNAGETLKFCKDHNILPELLTKEEIQSLIRQLNLKDKKTEELNSLDLETFQKFYIQMCHNIYYCKQNKVKMPLIEQLEQLLKHMQKAMLNKGENTALYENPDFVVGLDKQKLKILNQQIVLNPQLEIPEGFYKVYEKEIVMDYSIPEYLPIKESKVIALETLDTFLNDIFGIHFLEARAFPTVVPKIKQQQNIVQGKHKKNLNEINQQKQNQIKTQEQFSQLKKLNQLPMITQSMQQNIDQLFNIDPEKYPKENLEQVACSLEHILNKIDPQNKQIQQQQQQKQISFDPFQDKQQIINKIQIDKIKQEQEEKQREREREEKRLKHERELKGRLKYQIEEKEAKDYDNKKLNKEQELTELEKKKKNEEKRQKDFELKKKALEEKKLKDLDDLQKQKETHFEKQRIESEIKQKLKKEFLKLQKGKIKKEFDNKINERKDLETAQKQLIDKSNNRMNQIKSNMVDYIKNTKDDRKQEEEKQRDETNNFFNSEDTQSLFQKYDRGLKQYYKYYASQESQKIDFNLQAKNETISQNEFVKFGYQTNIYPALITNQELLYVFKQVVRERLQHFNHQQSSPSKQLSIYEKEVLYVIDFEYFKKSLIRIAALAQDKLQGQQNLIERIQSRSQQRKNIGTAADQSLTTQQKFNLGNSLTRKTIQQKGIKDIQDKIPKYDTKIEDKQITKQINVENLSTQILEKLLHFLDIGEGDTTTKISGKIHQSRIELSGQKPTKIKKEDQKKFND